MMKKLFEFNVLILTTFLFTHSIFAQKAFDEYAVDKNFLPFASSTNKALPNGTVDATVTINASNQINKVRQSVFGQNSVAWQGNVNSSARREEHWKNANFSLLRYPGGNWSNIFFWDGNTPATILTESTLNGNVGNLKKGTDAWMLGTDEFPDLLDHTGADGMVCVNVGYAFYGTSADPVTTAADYAAAWVNEYNNVQNLGIKYWELGNENYGPWQAGFDLATPKMYADACVIFAQKMKAIDPSIEIGVVLYEGEGGFNDTPQAKDWNEIVLPIVEDIADFLIIHHYPHPNVNQNDIPEDEIYEAIDVVHESYEMIQRQVTTYTSKPAGYYPIATTEFNMRCGIRNMSRANTLFTSMMLAEYAKHDYGAVTQWDLQNGYNTETGDHGLVSSRDPFLDEGSVNPEFYAFYYMDRYFGDMVVGASSDDNKIVSYATTFASGELGLIVVNRGAIDKVVDLNLNGYAAAGNMYWHTINGDDSDFDRTVYINGVGPEKSFVIGQDYTSNKGSNDNTQTATAFEENGVSGPQNYEEVLPFSTTIPAGEVKFDVPRYSVSYIVFEGSTTGCLNPDLGPDVELCKETSVMLDATVAAIDPSYSWTKDGVAISEETSIEVFEAGEYIVEVDVASCPLASDVITVTSSLLDVSHDTVCYAGETANLSINESGDFSWYDAAEDGLEVSTALSYSPTILADTYFYVQNNSQSEQVFGKSAIDGTTYGNTGATAYDGANRSLIFTIEQALTLKEFTVFAQAAGVNFVVNLNGNNLSYSKTWDFNGLVVNENLIALNETLAAGEYTMDFKGTVGGVKIQIDNPTNQSIPGLISFYVGGGNTDWYGMLFDLTVGTGGNCARTPVAAIIDPVAAGCVILNSNILEQSESLIIYPNPTTGLIRLSEKTEFTVLDMMGMVKKSGAGNQINISDLEVGVYIIETSFGRTKVIKQ